MSNVLVINSSAAGDASVSKSLVHEAVERLRAQDPYLNVVSRDLGENPVPHLTPAAATGLRAEPVTAEQAEARALSDALVAELFAADTVVIGAPMYNFGIASTLKSWFDYVLRAGLTFRYTEAGPEGLVTGKRAIVVLSRGGFYSEGPAAALDAQEPHLKTLLGFIGITDVTFVRAERLAFGPEIAGQSVEKAKAELHEVLKAA
jgi:FMN-dependent NADH-azoreductase